MFKKMVIFLLIAVCVFQSSPVYADRGGHGGHHSGMSGGEIAGVTIFSVAALLFTAALLSEPPKPDYVVVQPAPVLVPAPQPVYPAVPAPVMQAQPIPVQTSAPAQAAPSNFDQQLYNDTDNNDAFTIYLPKPNGDYTPIVLRKYSDGFLGPQGEYYEDHPTVEELEARYVRNQPGNGPAVPGV